MHIVCKMEQWLERHSMHIVCKMEQWHEKETKCLIINKSMTKKHVNKTEVKFGMGVF